MDLERQNRISSAIWAFHLVWQAHAPMVVGMLVSAVFSGFVPAAFAVSIRGLINSVTEAIGQGHTVLGPHVFWLTLAFGITIFNVVLALITQLLSNRLKGDLMLEVNTTVMRHASGLDLPYMEDADNRESINRVRQNPGARLHNLFSGVVSSGINMLQVISLIGLLAWLEPLVLLVAPVIAGPLMVFHWRLANTRYLTEYNRASKRRWSRYFLSKVTSPDTIGEIKQLRLGELLARRYATIMKTFREQDWRLQVRQFRGSAVFSVISTIAFYILFARVIYKVLLGFLTVGDLAIFGGAVMRLRSALQSSTRTVASVYEQVLYISDLRDFLDSEPKVHNAEVTITDPVRGELAMESVEFTYPGSSEVVLRDVSFHIKAGEKIAIVGENGSGKSTLAKLLVRLYDADSGEVSIDGKPIKVFEISYLHSRVALLAQGFGKYEASMAENIAYGDWGRLDGDRQAIEGISSEAGLDRIVDDLPDGLDTELGRQFSEYDLSGGQWQLLAIARTLARDASVLILDEPTSNIDARSEYTLFKAIEKIAEGKTTIVISHRFSTISMADRILVMHKGRIVEQGSHDELMSAEGRYRNLYDIHERYRANRA